MKKYVCSICGYIYDEGKGIPEAGISANTKWDELPDQWKCPICGAEKSDFKEMDMQSGQEENANVESPEMQKELSAMEMSIVCSNLSRGCEKQYFPEQAEAFQKLAVFFRNKAVSEEAPTTKLIELIKQDLEIGYPFANKVAAENADRGALRSLVWSEKVTRMLKSLLKRYEVEGNDMLVDTGVYVCTICGFIYIGEFAPEQCPVCKAPGCKFEKVEGGMT